MGLNLRLDDQDDDLLTSLAGALGMSKQQTVLHAVRELAARTTHQERVTDASRRLSTEYAEALDELRRA